MKRLLMIGWFVTGALGCAEINVDYPTDCTGTDTAADAATVAALDAAEAQACLADCTADTADACAWAVDEACITAQVDCRADCGTTCAGTTLEDLYWCIWDADSVEEQRGCIATYCDAVATCPWLDAAAVEYSTYYCG